MPQRQAGEADDGEAEGAGRVQLRDVVFMLEREARPPSPSPFLVRDPSVTGP